MAAERVLGRRRSCLGCGGRRLSGRGRRCRRHRRGGGGRWWRCRRQPRGGRCHDNCLPDGRGRRLRRRVIERDHIRGRMRRGGRQAGCRQRSRGGHHRLLHLGRRTTRDQQARPRFELIGCSQAISRDDGLFRDVIGLGDAAQRLPALDGYGAGLHRSGTGPTGQSRLALADNSGTAALHEDRRGSVADLRTGRKYAAQRHASGGTEEAAPPDC